MWKEKNELCKRLLFLVNFYNASDVRNKSLDLIRMILLVSPAEIMQNCIQIIYASYFNPNSTSNLHSFLMPKCGFNINSMAQSGINMMKTQLSPCQTTLQIINQIYNHMGPYFPMNKKQPNLAQIVSNIKNSANNFNKPHFNMFMPCMFIAHSHMNGATTLYTQLQNQSNHVHEYEKLLIDNFVPYFTFFDWLCKSVFINNHTKSLDVSSQANCMRQLINLILIITQQAIILNISFLSYINNNLFTNETNSSSNSSSNSIDTTSTSSSSSNSISSHNKDTTLNTEFIDLVAESSHFLPFVATILTHYRYLINRKEIYDFLKVFLSKYFILKMAQANVLNLDSQNVSRSSRSSIENDASTNKIVNYVKKHIEISCAVIHELRFYFEFEHVSKSLLKLLENQSENSATKTPTAPNITQNIELKSSQMIGSVKLVQLILAGQLFSSNEIRELIDDIEEYNINKIKIQVHKFLENEIGSFLAKQSDEMENFHNKLSKSKNGEKSVENQSNTENESEEEDEDVPSGSNNLKHKNKRTSLQKSKKAKTDDGEEDPTKEKSYNSISIRENNSSLLDSILKQIELKQKHLKQINQVLLQVASEIKISIKKDLNFLSSSSSTDISDTSSESSSQSHSPEDLLIVDDNDKN
jgi:hypothetical protein